MQKQAPTLGKLLVMVAFALSCVGLILFLWLTFGGSIPLAAKGYRVTIPLREASQLATEADVRISGVSVGKVKQIKLDADGKTTDAVVEMDERYAPLPKDTVATTRAKTLLGETYVELTPGTKRKGNMIPEGGTLAKSRVAPSVELDEILQTFDPRTRRDFQLWMQGLATAVRGRGQDLSNALGNLTPTAEDATDLIDVLNQQQTAVSRLVSNTGVVFNALGERDGQLRSLIDNSNRLFATTAQRDEQLRQIFQILPTFQIESRTTLRRLDAFTRNADPLVTQLRPAVRELSPTLRSLQRLSPDLRGLFEDLNPLIDASAAGLPATDKFLRLAQPVFAQLDPFLRNINPDLAGLSFYRSELVAFAANSAAATQATEGADGSPSTRLHYLRTTNPVGPESLAQYSQRLGTNRPNAYQAPLNFNKLATGLPVFENRQCGRDNVPTTINQLLTDAGIDPTTVTASTVIPGVGPVSSLLAPGETVQQMINALPPATPGLLDKIVFRDGAGVVAPGCTKQGPQPNLGGIPAGLSPLTDFPRLFEEARPDPNAPVTAARTASRKP